MRTSDVAVTTRTPTTSQVTKKTQRYDPTYDTNVEAAACPAAAKRKARRDDAFSQCVPTVGKALLLG